MPSLIGVVLAALMAVAVFTVVGLPIARLVLPPVLAPGLAPALGWAVISALAQPVSALVPFTRTASSGLVVCILLAALVTLRRWPWRRDAACLPAWAFVAAALLAVLPAMAIMPKHVATGILLGPPIFDHAKVAIIDEIARQGMPPANPFFGLAGEPSSLAYYYLWHFSAAVLAKITGASGWTADVAMTWCTAFAAMLLMMAVAVYLDGARRAAWLVAALSLPAGMRPVLSLALGHAAAERFMPPAADLGAWQNQASWVPQHLASASCVVLSLLLVARLARPDGWRAALVLPLVVAAGFESSTWVGGVAFAAACCAVAPSLLIRFGNQERRRFVRHAVPAVGAAALLIAPFLLAQAASVAARHAGAPVAFEPYQAFGSWVPPGARGLVGLLAFWPLVLLFNLPALVPASLVGGVLLWRTGRLGTADPEPRLIGYVLATGALACLCVVWLLKSRIENNDLGWRAVIPPLFVLTIFAASGWSRLIAKGAWRWQAALLGAALLGVPQAAIMLRQNATGQLPGDAAAVAQAGALWEAVRRHSAPGERVGNNPLLLAAATPWPDDIGWALLSDRPSCYAGWATAVAYAAIPRSDLTHTSRLFMQVFAGHAVPGDVDRLAWHYDCAVIVVTSGDGAWTNDAFAASPSYTLAEQLVGAWRIYRRIGQTAPSYPAPTGSSDRAAPRPPPRA